MNNILAMNLALVLLLLLWCFWLQLREKNIVTVTRFKESRARRQSYGPKKQLVFSSFCASLEEKNYSSMINFRKVILCIPMNLEKLTVWRSSFRELDVFCHVDRCHEHHRKCSHLSAECISPTTAHDRQSIGKSLCFSMSANFRFELCVQMAAIASRGNKCIF